MLLKRRNISNQEATLLMEIYEQSNKENISYFFPEVIDIEEGLKKVNEAHIAYIQDKFLKKDNVYYYMWEHEGKWVSALRLYVIQEQVYYIEALETHPLYRNEGYAVKLITEIIHTLKAKGTFEIRSYTSVKNLASRCTHKKCGFQEKVGRAFDYANEEWVEEAVSFIYKSN